MSGYLSSRLKLKKLKDEARGHEVKELFEKIHGISDQEMMPPNPASVSQLCKETGVSFYVLKTMMHMEACSFLVYAKRKKRKIQ